MNTREFQIIFDGNPMKLSEYYKHLGLCVYIDKCTTLNKHIRTKFHIFLAAMFS